MNDFTIKCDSVTATPAQSAPVQEPTFALPPKEPTQDAIEGIKFDINYGLRILFPSSGDYRCVFTDLDTGNLLYSMDVQPGCMVESVKKFYLRFGLEIYRRTDLSKPIFKHDMDLAGKEVLIQLPKGALGDTIAWFSYVERFQKKHKCKLYCTMTQELAKLFKEQYPDITFITKEDAAGLKPYATYNIGLFFKGDTDHQPYDFRQVGLHRTAGHILGLSNDELADMPPRVDLSEERQIKEKYVVIAAQASSQCKYWNNPFGWREVVEHLKKQGYRVLCIDRAAEYGVGYTWNRIPFGTENFTGDLPLQERINLIKDADMFIGLSSGLSWLAWCCKVPVVLISGFTDPVNEFYTPYRINNPVACHGCWHDGKVEFDHFDFFWCPRKTNINDKFECTKMISSKQVIGVIDSIIERSVNGTGNGESAGK